MERAREVELVLALEVESVSVTGQELVPAPAEASVAAYITWAEGFRLLPQYHRPIRTIRKKLAEKRNRGPWFFGSSSIQVVALETSMSLVYLDSGLTEKQSML